MKSALLAIRRPAYFLTALALLVGFVSGAGYAFPVGAQVQFRSIEMSDSGASGGAITTGVGSGTNVSYQVSFKAATSYTLKGVIVDFCDGTGTPFIGDSNCPDPTGFTIGSTPTVDTNTLPDNLGTGWTAADSAGTSAGQTLQLTNSGGLAVTAGTVYTFTITGVTNPSAIGTFYARLITYTSATGDVTTYTHANPGTTDKGQDYGGFALSTANVVQVTAKVQESLTFCASAALPGTDCSGTSAPAITLGHGTNNTLDTSAVDTKQVFTQVSTNALHGVDIRMHNSNACGGLSTDGGTTCNIPGTGGSTPTLIVAGTADFGLFCANGTGGTGTVTADPNYNDGASTDYGMDTTTVGANVSSTYGDIIAASSAPVNNVDNTLTFAATASNTTPAGIYTANMALIATGTF